MQREKVDERNAKHKRNMADKEERNAKGMERKQEVSQKKLSEEKHKFRHKQEVTRKR